MSNPYALHMPHWPLPGFAEPTGTPSQRARALLARLGHPERALPPVVHVGGTKGKGSTIAFLRAMLEAAGYRVHSYTSPHLARFNERLVLAGREIDDAALYAILEETRLAAGDMPLGFFDATTAAAMLAFARTPADILLMEMGLGGAVDATNVIDHPRLTILTTVSYDHMEFMGTTLESIAAFEAGLFKAKVPSVISYQPEGVMPALERVAHPLHVPFHTYGKHWLARKAPHGMIYADMHGEALLPYPSLLGPHQIVNAGNAIAALSVMDEFEVTPEHVMQGLTQAKWKGRLERLEYSHLPAHSELWFDGGHNMAAGQAIALFAHEYWLDMPLYLIFGTSQGKPVADILAPFQSIAKRVYAVGVKSEPRSYAPDAIVAATHGLIDTVPAQGIESALSDIAKRETRPFRALVFGSLYLWLEASSLAG